jgi:hypothetical protein
VVKEILDFKVLKVLKVIEVHKELKELKEHQVVVDSHHLVLKVLKVLQGDQDRLIEE